MLNSSSNTQTSKSLLVENRRIALGQSYNPEKENKIENAGILIYNLYSSSNYLSPIYTFPYTLRIWTSSQLAYSKDKKWTNRVPLDAGSTSSTYVELVSIANL